MSESGDSYLPLLTLTLTSFEDEDEKMKWGSSGKGIPRGFGERRERVLREGAEGRSVLRDPIRAPHLIPGLGAPCLHEWRSWKKGWSRWSGSQSHNYSYSILFYSVSCL
jgi:hypothetical protein